MKGLIQWIDDRLGLSKIWATLMHQEIPGGSRWRYVWGTTFAFAFLMQVITGICLWSGYSPSALTAWESIYHLQESMNGGRLLRGLHHWMAQIVVVLLLLQMGRIIIDGTYRSPREFNYWVFVLLFLATLAILHTGYLLPWDQKGYWATQVATSIVGATPGVGGEVQKVLVGGGDFGHQTLTRFFALHAGILPATILGLLAFQFYLNRKHGFAAKEPLRGPTVRYFPDQFLKDMVACLCVAALVFTFATVSKGASFSAPADPSQPYNAARPEWYFLSLFQFLKFFHGPNSLIWGAFVFPGIAVGLLLLVPITGKWIGRAFNVAFFFVLISAFVFLTSLALYKDAKSDEYKIAYEQGQAELARVEELIAINGGIPPAGAASLMADDPLIQGPRLFAAKCASCHAFDGHNGQGLALDDPQSAPDLKGFASREWLDGLLNPEKIATAHYFKNTAFVSKELGGTGEKNNKMVEFILDEFEATPEELAQVAAALSAQAKLGYQAEADAKDRALIDEGWDSLIDDVGCLDCHSAGEGDGTAMDLAGYGSRQWMIDFIADPTDNRFYGKRNDRMPAFGKKGILTPREIELIVDWLRQDWPTADKGRESAR